MMKIETKKIGMKHLFEALVFTIIMSVLGFNGADIWMFLSVGIITLMFLFCLGDVNSNSFFLFFLLSFFIFLMSGDITELLFDKKYYLQFSKEAVLHAHKCIFISLSAMWIGYYCTSTNKKVCDNKKTDNKMADAVKSVSKMAYYLSYFILLINTIDTVNFVAKYGYVAYYTSFDPVLPSVIIEIGEFAPLALCVYLATFPTKKDSAMVIRTFLLYALLTLFIGSRSGVIYNTVFIICYCLYRNNTDKGETVWLPKKLITIFVLSVPFVFSFLFVYEYIRTGRTIEYVSFWDTLIDFFVNIGSASQNIKYGYEYRNEIPKMRFYSFGGTLNYFKYGTLFNLFELSSIPSRHSIEFALESHSFDSMLSYLTIPTQFLQGNGTGSSFIAELFADMGYIGVAFGSVVYGIILKKLTYLDSSNCIYTTIKLYIYFTMLSAPRASYDGFIAVILNVNNVLFIGLIYLFSNIIFQKNKNKVRSNLYEKNNFSNW